jgi:hypothetical protein
MPAAKKLGEILVDLHVLKFSDVERVMTALRRRGGRLKFGDMARSMGLLREEHILAALAVQLQLLPGLPGLSVDRILSCLEGGGEPEATPVQTSR